MIGIQNGVQIDSQCNVHFHAYVETQMSVAIQICALILILLNYGPTLWQYNAVLVIMLLA